MEFAAGYNANSACGTANQCYACFRYRTCGALPSGKVWKPVMRAAKWPGQTYDVNSTCGTVTACNGKCFENRVCSFSDLSGTATDRYCINNNPHASTNGEPSKRVLPEDVQRRPELQVRRPLA